MSKENYLEIKLEDGTTFQCIDVLQFENNEYALLKMKDDDTGVIVMHIEKEGEDYSLSLIDNEEEFKRVCDYIELPLDDVLSETELYMKLDDDEYKHGSYEIHDLGEGMAVINEIMWGWWKPRYLVNHNTRCAYEFIDSHQRLLTVTEDDIDWDSLNNLPEDAISRARALSFHFPSFIRDFKNGVAQVSWQINPDGRYYMDDDGFGMTDDEEITIYGFIDQTAKVLVKFKNINGRYAELDKMRKEAEKLIKSRRK